MAHTTHAIIIKIKYTVLNQLTPVVKYRLHRSRILMIMNDINRTDITSDRQSALFHESYLLEDKNNPFY